MNSIAQKSLYLSLDECFLLFSSLDISNITVFDELTLHKTDDRKLIYALKSLINKGVMESNGEKTSVAPAFVDLGMIINNSPFDFVIRYVSDSYPMQCVYICNGYVVIIENDPTRIGYYKIEQKGLNEWILWLKELEFFPRGSCSDRRLDEIRIKQISKEIRMKKWNEENNTAIMRIKRFPKGNEKEDLEFMLIRDTLYDAFVISCKEMDKIVAFSSERLSEYIDILGKLTAEEIIEYDPG